MVTISAPCIDHIIILLPYEDIINPPEWLTDNFTISPGGRHADGKTENRLILLQDGSYIELIAFIDDDTMRRKGHWWDKPYGIVDYALTSSTTFDASLIELPDEISYTKPQAGGRIRPDGKRMEWLVTFPSGIDRGKVPFWCHDITPREVRVPLKHTEHPCGAKGVHVVEVTLPADESRSVDEALTVITSDADHKVSTVNTIDNAETPQIKVIGGDRHEIRLSLFSDSPCQDIVHDKVHISFQVLT